MTKLVLIDLAKNNRRKYHYFYFYEGKEKKFTFKAPKGNLDHQGTIDELKEWFDE